MIERNNNNHSNPENGYIRVGEPDNQAIAALILAAQGRRSMRSFAEELGVNASTLSRLISGKKNSISMDLICRIVEKSVPDSGVTVERFLEAKGLAKDGVQYRIKMKMLYEESCRQIIVDELIKRGASVRYMPDDMFGRAGPDIVLKTNELGPGEKTWVLYCPVTSNFSYMSYDSLIHRMIAVCYQYQDELGRASIVLDSDISFKKIQKQLQLFRWKNDISIILISTTENRVFKEYTVPRYDGTTPIVIFPDTGEETTYEEE